MAQTSPTATAGERLEEMRHALSSLLDTLAVERCIAVGNITSTMLAMSCRKHMSDRIAGVINVNPILPTIRGNHVRLLDMTERMRMQMMRALPSIGKFLVHGALAKVDTGYDQEYIHKFLDRNEFDLRWTERDDIKHLFRDAFRTTTRQGYDAFYHELVMASSDWHDLMERQGAPYLNLIGSHNIHYTPHVLEAFARENDGFTIEVVPRAGHLLMYQKPEVIFARVAELAKSQGVSA